MNSSSSFTEILSPSEAKKTQKLIVLGASGSVGGSCMEYLKSDSSIQPVAISVHSSISKLKIMLEGFEINNVCITNESSYDEAIEDLKKRYKQIHFFRGQSGVLEMIQRAHEIDGADTVLTAVVGSIGIEATMLSLKLGLKIALANKETMVTAGPAIRDFVLKQIENKQKIPVILPVDSEHNAVFQLINGLHESHLKKVILTASGGPFRNLPVEKLSQVTREEVLNHPTWSMGPKITVDSAGMINKGLEIIEAHFLFSINYDKLDVLIHPDSLVHAMVATTDGGYLFCASQPNMVFPIAHALYYPEAIPIQHPISTTPDTWKPLQFEKVDVNKYKGYWTAIEAGKRGGTAPAIFNAANEVAVEQFLKGAIEFIQIPELLEKVLDHSNIQDTVVLEDFLEADKESRIMATEFSKKMKTRLRQV